jgi:hypothetical protein
MNLRRYKNYKKTPVNCWDKKTSRNVLFAAGEEKELGECWDEIVLSHGIVPLDEVERKTQGEEELAKAEAEAKAKEEAEAAEMESKRADALKKAAEAAESSANVKKAAQRAKK